MNGVSVVLVVCVSLPWTFSVPLVETFDSHLLPSFNGVDKEVKPKITPTVYAVQGVETCGEGRGFCVFGKVCEDVDREFQKDENGGHCTDMAYKVTPYAEFVCCKHVPVPLEQHDDFLTWGDQGNGTWNLPPLIDGPLDLAPTQLEEIDDSNMVTLVINGHTFIFSSETFSSVSDPMELFQLFSESIDNRNNTVEIVRETVQHYTDDGNQKVDDEIDNDIYSDVLTSAEQAMIIDNDKFTFDGMVVGSFRQYRKPLTIKMPPIPMMPEFLMEDIRRERENKIKR